METFLTVVGLLGACVAISWGREYIRAQADKSRAARDSSHDT